MALFKCVLPSGTACSTFIWDVKSNKQEGNVVCWDMSDMLD
jgi:hypothetical protein